MPRDSLKSLLQMFPHFLDEDSTSNFYKSQSVTNKQFQETYQSMLEVKDNFNLDKRCLVWRVQEAPHEYTMNFVANVDNIKSVTLYKNDNLIYTETYTYEDNVNNFFYSYESTTLNDIYELVSPDNEEEYNIIPASKYEIHVETYNEYKLLKGYPENDINQGNIYDHNPSLDKFGKLHNIPRKQYIIVDSSEYPYTEPPYNNAASEDDYHYMNRIINYVLQYHTTPLPVLEIWKLYGINAVMENREKYLLKMFDIKKHPHYIDETADGDQLFVDSWVPEIWEHKDRLCSGERDLGEYFFASANTIIPVKNEDVILSFKFLNSLAEPLTGNYSISLKVNDTSIVTDYTNSVYTLSSELLSDDTENIVEIQAYNNDNIEFATETIKINVRGCNNADWYVSASGSDSNDGKTSNTAFATLQKALSSLTGDGNLIVIGAGDYTQNNALNVPNSCTILGCGEVTVENTNDNTFFSLPVNCNLTLQDLTLEYDTISLDIDSYTFVNENPNNQRLNVFIDEPFEEEE